MSHVQMIQTAKYRWQIVATESGVVLQKDINVASLREAEEYVKNYVSSFNAWMYNLVPMVEKGNYPLTTS